MNHMQENLARQLFDHFGKRKDYAWTEADWPAVRAGLVKLQAAIDTKDLGQLLDKLHTGNLMYRTYFAGVTGKALPNTNAATKSTLEGWVGSSVTLAYHEAQVEAHKAREESDAKAARAQREHWARHTFVRHNGKTITYADYTTQIIAEGFTWLAREQVGAVSKWALWHTDGRQEIVLHDKQRALYTADRLGCLLP